ncbi:hypothetical protein HDU76_011657 [Blyttiomyces sp. JEL0837]|nr:hypothetical protein HDU76_011657 [Blyttiomyces sp. JEL0837]
MTSHLNDPKVAKLRNLLLTSLKAISPTPAILLSGGLDTSIIADGGTNILNLTDAITVSTGPSPPDEPYATHIAKSNKLTHHLLKFHDPMVLIDPSPSMPLHFAITTLRSFDPMELRGGVAIAKALMFMRESLPGLNRIATGDGADELFAGYSFMHNMEPAALRGYIDNMIKTMKFSAVPLGKALGIQVVQPFLDPDVIAYSMTLEKSDLVGDVDVPIQPGNQSNESSTKSTSERHGKLILRYAFPEAYSCWRTKQPVEVGSGTTMIGTEFEKRQKDLDVESIRAQIWLEDGVRIRDAEHLHYYRVFREAFVSKTGEKDSAGRNVFDVPGVVRYGSDPCKDCGWQLQAPTQSFCVVCGAWPARETVAA